LILFVVAILFYGCYSHGVDEDDTDPPDIISKSSIEASGGIPFIYQAECFVADSSEIVIGFKNYPGWLTAHGDSIYGTPAEGLADTSFTVIAYAGVLSDTLKVHISMNPALVVYGDSRSGHIMHRQVVDQIVATHPLAVFHTGDLVNDGYSTYDWDMFNDITDTMRTISEFYPVLGNHENQSPLYFDQFDLPNNEQWYSVDRNYIHFIALNSCVASDTLSEQYFWLKSDLMQVPLDTRFIIAYFHHPPYSTGAHAEDEMNLRESFVPLFNQYGVDAVFNGHNHCYERSYCGGIYYIVAGGGGAPLHDQSGTDPCSQLYLKSYHYCKLSLVDNILYVNVINQNGEIIDSFSIEQPD